jgi:prophage regulatory protein
MAQGSFPRPVRIGKRAVGWVESEVDGWIEARIAERDAKAKNK